MRYFIIACLLCSFVSAQEVTFKLPSIDNRSIDKVTAVMVLEAGGEKAVGMQAVLSVIANRANQQPNKMAHVLVVPRQFGSLQPFTAKKWVNWDAAIAKAQRHGAWSQARNLVLTFLDGKVPDNTNGATYFLASFDHPAWERDVVYIKTIGGHRFFRD